MTTLSHVEQSVNGGKVYGFRKTGTLYLDANEIVGIFAEESDILSINDLEYVRNSF